MSGPLDDRKSLTATELIAALSKLEPSTVVYWQESDFERDCSYLWSVDGVDESGGLQHGDIIASWDGMDEPEDDEDE